MNIIFVNLKRELFKRYYLPQQNMIFFYEMTGIHVYGIWIGPNL